jgi:hypothetical protein
LPAANAAFFSKRVNGAAVAKDASAVAIAPARTAALTVDLVDMFLSPVELVGALLLARRKVSTKGGEATPQNEIQNGF